MEAIDAGSEESQDCVEVSGCLAAAELTTTANRRISFGYINEQFMIGHWELGALRREIVERSHVAGCELAAIYIERVETSPSAWRALVEKVAGNAGSTVVIVSGLHHLASIGHPHDVRNILLGSDAEVLVVGRAVE